MSAWTAPFPWLLLNNVSCMRNAQQVLQHVNVSLHDGGALVLTGAIGSGKSTFLRMLAGFSHPSAGEILWNGHNTPESGIFQQYKLQLELMGLGRLAKEKPRMLPMGQRKRLQLARLLEIWSPHMVAGWAFSGIRWWRCEVTRVSYCWAQETRRNVIEATHLPIEIEDSMVLRLPPRFPRRMTSVDQDRIKLWNQLCKISLLTFQSSLIV